MVKKYLKCFLEIILFFPVLSYIIKCEVEISVENYIQSVSKAEENKLEVLRKLSPFHTLNRLTLS